VKAGEDFDLLLAAPARGEVELGMVVVTEIVTTAGVELAARCRRNRSTSPSRARSARSPGHPTRRALVKFLKGSGGAAVMKKHGAGIKL
jgi:hypothetical protein